jgi:hypothetical protein
LCETSLTKNFGSLDGLGLLDGLKARDARVFVGFSVTFGAQQTLLLQNEKFTNTYRLMLFRAQGRSPADVLNAGHRFI